MSHEVAFPSASFPGRRITLLTVLALFFLCGGAWAQKPRVPVDATAPRMPTADLQRGLEPADSPTSPQAMARAATQQGVAVDTQQMVTLQIGRGTIVLVPTTGTGPYNPNPRPSTSFKTAPADESPAFGYINIPGSSVPAGYYRIQVPTPSGAQKRQETTSAAAGLRLVGANGPIDLSASQEVSRQASEVARDTAPSRETAARKKIDWGKVIEIVITILKEVVLPILK
jgi:hypothetical protein